MTVVVVVVVGAMVVRILVINCSSSSSCSCSGSGAVSEVSGQSLKPVGLNRTGAAYYISQGHFE